MPVDEAAAGQCRRPWSTWAGCAELRGISVAGGMVTIGASARHAEVAASADVAQGHPGAGRSGRRHRRPDGAQHAAPSADRSPTPTRRPAIRSAILGMGATVKTNKRTIAGDQLFKVLTDRPRAGRDHRGR
jgi:carbon-monoxide dehydrogenase medium subunit